MGMRPVEIKTLMPLLDQFSHDQIHTAAMTCAQHAVDKEDLTELLNLLGLMHALKDHTTKE